MKVSIHLSCGPKGSFTPSNYVALTGKMGMQPILPITVTVKKIKGAIHQCYGDSDGFTQCE